MAGFFARLFSRGNPAPARPRARKSWDAAKPSRLYSHWPMSSASFDADLRRALPVMRARSRNEAQNNDYMKGFLRQVRRHVVGPAGMTLQMKCENSSGAADDQANRKIESAWAKWGKKGICTTNGQLSWRDVQGICAVQCARDGEVLVRKVRGFDNGFGFALQILDPDRLETEYFRTLPNGNEIRMGIEYDANSRPVAYHLLGRHPGADWAADQSRMDRIRVPAADMIHLFAPESAEQGRGVPWAVTALKKLNMADGYEEAALTAARVGAAKMGFFEEEEAEAATEGRETDDAGNPIADADPGHFETLPPGVKFKEFDPTYPTGEMDPFMRLMLRSVATGMGVSYHGLSSDLSDANFSSLRAGKSEEQDEWETIQAWLRESLHENIFADWLPLAMLSNQVALPLAKIEQFNKPNFLARGWDYVNPLDEIEADAQAVALGVMSRRRIAARRGIDFSDVLKELKQEQDEAAGLGVSITPPVKMPSDQATREDGQTDTQVRTHRHRRPKA